MEVLVKEIMDALRLASSAEGMGRMPARFEAILLGLPYDPLYRGILWYGSPDSPG